MRKIRFVASVPCAALAALASAQERGDAWHAGGGLRVPVRIGWLAAALCAAAWIGRAEAQEVPPAADPGASPGTAPAAVDRPAPRALGRIGVGIGAAVTDEGLGFALSASAGAPLSDRLRVDLVLSVASRRGDFDAPPPPPGLGPVQSSTLEVARGAAEITLTHRTDRFEAWAGAGWAHAEASAEVLGPYGCVLVFCGDQIIAEGSGSGSGPIVSAGARVTLTSLMLVGLELHKPFIHPVELGVPLRVNLGAPYFVANLSLRFWGGRPRRPPWRRARGRGGRGTAQAPRAVSRHTPASTNTPRSGAST